MNIVLNTPLSDFASTQEYDNKILFIFLILIFSMVVLGLVFVDIAKEASNNIPPSTVEQQTLLTKL